MPDVDYYDILDVRPTASAEEIKAAYYRAVRSAHPDAGGTAGMFRLVSEAYRTLADPQARAAYDARIAGGGYRGAADAPEAEADAPHAEPAWGEEEVWAAEPPRTDTRAPQGPYPETSADEFVDRQVAKMDRWIVTDTARWVLLGTTLAILVIYGLLTYVVIGQQDLLRPVAAGQDVWGDLLGNSSALRLTVISYAVLALGGYLGLLWIPLTGVHAVALIGAIAWFLAYWGPAAGGERGAFIGVLVLWLVYAALMGVLPFMRLYRIRELNELE